MPTSVVKATIWSALQRFGSLGISFISNMVLARLLCPEDFGLIAMIMVFVGIADVLVDGGLGNALIQKNNIEDKDINTVYTANLGVSVLFYALIFALSPVIASYTELPKLTLCLRVQAITVIIKALYVVHFSLLNKNLQFKELALIGLIANGIATLLAIALAYWGLGVWSLIFRNIILDVIFVVFYLYVSKEKIRLGFSKDSFLNLFNFGFFVAISNVLETLYSNFLTFLIGKRYSVRDLGYYNQAYSLHQIPVYSISAVVNQVSFPFFSKMQESKEQLKQSFAKTISLVTFVVYPILTYLVFFGKPVIVLLYSDKWVDSVPLFQVLCFAGFFNALIHLCRSTIKALGDSKLLLKAQLLSVVLGLIVIAVFLSFDIKVFVFAVVINSVLTYLFVAFLAGRMIEFSVWSQIRCLLLNFVASIISVGLVAIMFEFFPDFNLLLTIILSLLTSSIFYLLIHYIFKSNAFCEAINLIKINK